MYFMNDIKFSIIVPAYNVADYIGDCLDSILNQTYKNFEVLVVNDGSTDNTHNICEYYKNKDSRILVFNKTNGGLSDARNYGMKRATGEYIVFIDSDDYIHTNSLEEFSKKLYGNPDVLITRLVQTYEIDKKIEEMDKHMKIELCENPSKKRVIDWVFCKTDNTWPAPKYIVSTSLIKKANISFRVGFLHEDLDWTVNLFYYANNFAVCYLPWYFHRISRTNSITTSSNYKRVIDVICMASEIINDNKYNSLDISIKNKIYKRVIISVFSILNQYKLVDDYGKKEIILCIKKHKNLFNKVYLIKYKVFVYFMKLFGVKAGMDMLSKIN